MNIIKNFFSNTLKSFELTPKPISEFQARFEINRDIYIQKRITEIEQQLEKMISRGLNSKIIIDESHNYHRKKIISHFQNKGFYCLNHTMSYNLTISLYNV